MVEAFPSLIKTTPGKTRKIVALPEFLTGAAARRTICFPKS
jgi:hypothetical protein